jgi:FkbM family methyltransferase
MSGAFNFLGMTLQGDPAAPSSLADMLEVFELLKPKPSSHPLMRIGDNCDGSYLVPEDLDGITACFSPGVNNFKHFEDTLVDTYGIDCHMCDYSSDVQNFQTPLKEGRQTFQKKWLDVKTERDNISFDDWISEYAPTGDLLLQMDIEGAEYRNLLSISEAALSRFRIIILEVHGLEYIKSALVLRNVLAPTFKRLAGFFSVAHAHPNNCCGDFAIPGTGIRIPNVLELTYIRKDRLTAPEYAPLLPHPLDVSQNVRNKPPLFLGEEWLEKNRPLESKLKMMEDRLEGLISAKAAQPPSVSADQGDLILRSLHTLTEKVAVLAGQPEGGAEQTRDVAAGRRYVLSSSYGETGNTGHVHQSDTFFFHTGFGNNQFIQVDLGRVHNIGRIRIANRADACFDRAKNLFAILSTGGNPNRESVFYVHTPAAFLSGAARECDLTIPTSPARFVTLVSAAETALHLSDLKIFAVD